MTANKNDVIGMACDEFSHEKADSFLALEDDPSYLKLIPSYLVSTSVPVIIAKDLKVEKRQLFSSLRRVNPKIHDVIKKEVEKLLDAGLIYPISDSPWVSPVHCVPKKGGMTVITNDENELIPTRLVTGWRVCIDYKNVNDSHPKGTLPIALHGPNARKTSRKPILLFPRWLLGLFSDPN
ncbi:hypothetical protein Tco_0109725 [Tanacetum coccineum]